jgi:small subunit ribosomal protein S15
MAMTKEVKETLVKDFSISVNDTGSASVQVALLTEDIKMLTEHCRQHPKDFSSRRGLLKKVCSRRKFLKYLSRRNQDAYAKVTSRLGL